jgi:hypothetical protein
MRQIHFVTNPRGQVKASASEGNGRFAKRFLSVAGQRVYQ